MTDIRPFDPALFGDAAIDPDTANLNDLADPCASTSIAATRPPVVVHPHVEGFDVPWVVHHDDRLLRVFCPAGAGQGAEFLSPRARGLDTRHHAKLACGFVQSAGCPLDLFSQPCVRGGVRNSLVNGLCGAMVAPL